MDDKRDLHVVAAFVHGMLAALHMIGVGYNLRRRNWKDLGMHLLAIGYSAYAVNNHRKDLR